jgi:hypothetical protein
MYWMLTRQRQVKETEGGTIPPLARKRKDDWQIYLHLIRGFSHR